MAYKRALYELEQEDLGKVSAGHTQHIAVVIRSPDQSIYQTGGSQLDVVTNNRTIIDSMSIGRPSN
jgi:hypothetical protein